MAESMAKLVKPCRCPVWCYLLLAVACVASVDPWHFVGPKRPNVKRVFPHRRAEGYFPGVDVELTEPPSRGSLLEKLQSSIPEDPSVGEHTEEVKLLREQTAILAQELRLLKELLQDGALADAIELSLSKVTEIQEPSLSSSPPEEPKVELEAPEDSIDEIGMSSLLSSQGTSYRHSESLEALDHLSKRVVERRVEGELPLGQDVNGLSPKVAGLLCGASTVVQRVVLDQGSLATCRDPNAGCVGRIRKAERSAGRMHTPSRDEVEAFIEENELNERAGEALRGAKPTNLSILSA
eukprot:symbB.v1.2.011758.t1/scaffold750.1/size323489/10